MLVPVDSINSAMALSAHFNALSIQTCAASDTAKYYISIKTLKRKVGLFLCVFITSKRHIVVKGEHEQGLCTKIFFCSWVANIVQTYGMSDSAVHV